MQWPTLVFHRFLGSDFMGTCQAKKHDFSEEGFSRLHQWQLWQEGLKSDVRLPPSLRDKCQKTMISARTHSSNLHADVVVFELSSMGLRPKDEFLANSGYRLDAHVEVR
jgi:hypothetical protein